LERVEVEREINLNISRGEILSLLEERVVFVEHLRDKLNNIYNFSKQKQDYDHINELVIESVTKSLGGLPEGTIFTEELMRELIEEFLEKFARFMHHSFYREEKESQPMFNSYEDESEHKD
jgi:hypothetical protein